MKPLGEAEAAVTTLSAVDERECEEHGRPHDSTTAAAVSSAPAEEGEREKEAQPRRRDEEVANLGGDNAVALGLNERRRDRGRRRENTGVAALLVALAKADPSGDSIRALQRWVVEAVVPWWTVSGVDSVLASHDVFVDGKKADRMRWMRSCREVGEVIRLLVGALDEQGEEGPADGQAIKA